MCDATTAGLYCAEQNQAHLNDAFGPQLWKTSFGFWGNF